MSSFGPIFAVRRAFAPATAEQARRAPEAARAAQRRFVRSFGQAPSAASAPPPRALGPFSAAFLPAGAPPKPGAVVYIHGGGLVFYDLEAFAPALARLADASGRKVIALGYPKAPETPPGSIVEHLALALGQVLPEAGPDPILAGDSVGALLSLHLALARPQARWSRLVMIYPMLNLSPSAAFDSYERFGRGFLLDRPFLDWFRQLARAALPEGFDPLELTEEQARRLPPVEIVAAGQDMLRDESLRFAELARGRGAGVTHALFEHLPHDFCLYAGRAPEAADALAFIGRRCLV